MYSAVDALLQYETGMHNIPVQYVHVVAKTMAPSIINIRNKHDQNDLRTLLNTRTEINRTSLKTENKYWALDVM
jgi:hypothetical protein